VPVTMSCSTNDAASGMFPFSFGGQLSEDQETIPLDFWNAPTSQFAVTTLQPNGADMVAAMQAGNFPKTIAESGDAPAVQGLNASQFSYAYSTAPVATGKPTVSAPLVLPGAGPVPPPPTIEAAVQPRPGPVSHADAAYGMGYGYGHTSPMTYGPYGAFTTGAYGPHATRLSHPGMGPRAYPAR
jgi:hypothetical protein